MLMSLLLLILMLIIPVNLVLFILNISWIKIDEFVWLSENNDVFVLVQIGKGS